MERETAMSNGDIDGGKQTNDEAGAADRRSARVTRSAGLVSLAVMTSRILGLVREMVFASLFGASMSHANDAFVMAFRIPNLLRDLFAEGALSNAFVTVFSDYLVKKDEREAFRLSSLVATSLILILGVLVVLGMIFTPQIVGVLASGYKDVPNKFEDTVYLTRIMMPFILLVALAAQAMGVLNARGRFGIPALASTFFNIGSIVGGLIFAALMTDPADPIDAIKANPRDGIIGMAYGVLIGGLMQYAVQWPSLRRAGFRYRPMLAFSDPGVRRIFSLMGPAVVGAAAVQVNVLINSNFAAGIPGNGPVGWLNYAFRLMQFPIGVFGVAIATATLPSISRSASLENLNEFRETLGGSLRLAFVLTIPSAVGLIVLGKPIIGLIYERQQFTANDTEHTAGALAFYAVGLAGYSAIKILAPAFYALGDARTPMAVSVATIVVNFLMNFLLVDLLQERGLALSTSTVALLNFALLYVLIGKRIGGLEGRRTAAAAGKIVLSSGVMGAACWAVSSGLGGQLSGGLLARTANVLASVVTGAIVFYACARLLGVRELKSAVDAIGSRLIRRR
jgi:putative peptidoglycan lipid II flippase